MSTYVRFMFGEFELDPNRFELRRDGTPLEVQPKVLRLLCHLAMHRDRAVDNAELLRTLWPDATVGHGSIKRAVLGARKALGESASSQLTIRTVRGHGYHFVRDVEVIGAAPKPTHSAEQTDARVATPPPAPGAHEPFLGREGVLAVIEACVHEVLQGTTRCILLTGGPGLGKTRTAEELYRRARALGAQCWLGRCPELEGVPAFWPFIQVLRAALSERGDSEMQRLLGREGADMAGVMPELRQFVTGLPDTEPLSTQTARFRMYDALSTFLRRAAEVQPVVVGIDDLHHADPATLQLLTFLARQLLDARVLFVGTFRREAPHGSVLPPLLDALSQHDTVRCVELQGFTQTELARYIEWTAGIAPTPGAVALLHEQTAGNPLFVRQLIESWRAQAELSAEQSFPSLTSLTASQGLRGSILRHLDVVSPECRDLLRMAAVLGRDFSAAQLARVAEQPVGALCSTLAGAEATSLVQRLPEQVASYRFTHGLIRDALYAQLTAAERGELHGRAGFALEALAGGAQTYVSLAEITRHFVLAAPTHDAGRALGYSLRAADSALARLAHEEAAEHFEHALQLSLYHEPDPVRHLSLLLRKGDALARTSEPDAGRAALFEAAELASELDDCETLYAAASLLADRPEPGSVDEKQIAVLEQAQAALAPDDGRRVLLLALQAKSLAYASTPRERVRRGRLALSQARALAPPALRAQALTCCLEALVGPDQLDERRVLASELLDLAEADGDAGALLGAWAAQIETCVERGDMATVDTALHRMEELALRVREPRYRWQAKAVRSMQAFVQGRLEHAEQCAREALQLGAAISEELARHIYCAQTFGLFVLTGRPKQAWRSGREMAERYPGIAGWVAARGVGDVLLGRREQGRACLAQIMERGVSWICSEPYLLSGLCSVSELCLLVGATETAKELYAATLPYARHHGLTHTGAANYGPMARQLAGLAACAGDFAGADRHYTEAMHEAVSLGSPTFECLTATAHALLLLEGGYTQHRSQAQALLGRAQALAHSCGMTAMAGYCEENARKHGVHQAPANVIAIPTTRRSSRG